MGDVVNLNAYRKKRAREALKKKASENRARHGRDRGEKRLNQVEQERATAQLDGKKRDRDAPGGSDD